MTFGHGTDKKTAGINFFDTADAYAGGESEKILGKALKGRRREAVVASKFFNPMGTGPNDSGMSRVHIMQAIEDSLTRLKMDYLDLYYIHHVDVDTPLEEMLEALDNLVQQGKVRYIACSNYEAWRLATALGISDRLGRSRFVCYQPQYSLVVRDIEQELVPLCDYHGLGIVVWAPLAGGFLSGKYDPGQVVKAGTRSEEGWAYPEPFFHPNAAQILETLYDIAAATGRSPAQVAIRWVTQQPGITSAIIGARTLEQLEDNLGAARWLLEEEQLLKLNAVSQPRELYPKSMEKHMKARRAKALQQYN